MIKKLHEWKMSIRDYKHKKGFTLIELIVVMAIIAILVLLAAPRFLGRTEDALATRIKNDITAAETKVDEYLIKHEGLEEWGTSVNVSELNGLIEDGTLHARDGVMDSEDAATVKDVPYYKVPASFVGDTVQSDLDGDFYTNEEGEVYYNVGAGGVVTDGFEIPDQYVLATDDDFMYFDDEDAPDGKGFHLYVGDAEYMIIPDSIDNKTVTNAYRMFGWGETAPYEGNAWGDYIESPIKGVAGNNPNLTDMKEMFQGTSPVGDGILELDYLDTSHVTNMEAMFWISSATGVTFGESFDTSNVTNMQSMFNRSSVKHIDVSNFDTSNVSNMGHMFRDMQAETITFGGAFDTSNVTNMERMFGGINNVEEIDLSSFNTSNVTDMSSMFASSQLATPALTSVNLSSFDTSKVTDMEAMFKWSRLTNVDLGSFNTSNVTNMRDMFSESFLTELDLSSFDTTNVMGMVNMFSYAKATTGYARTQEDLDRFTNSSRFPLTLDFTIK